MVIKFREFHRRMSIKTTYDYSLFIFNNLYKFWFELFGLIYLEVFSKFIIYSFFNIKQGSSIVKFSWSVFNIVSLSLEWGQGSKESNCIQVGNKNINNPIEIANSFNNHFTSIAEKIEDNLVKLKFNSSRYLSNPNEYSVFIKPTNAEEVLHEITKLKNNKSIGPSSILPEFVKLFKTTLSEPISLIANISFSTGAFPSTSKTTNVISIYKKDDHPVCNNYRPISLLSNISKTIQKLVHNRLSTFLNKNSILYEKQFVFRNDHSTTHALLEITEKTKQAVMQFSLPVEYFSIYKKHLRQWIILFFWNSWPPMGLEA